MKVILNDNVPKLGYRGDVIDVKDGYFRNFLFPRRLAVVATKKGIELCEKRREKMVLTKGQLLENVKEAIGKLKGLSVEISAKVTGEGKDTLYAALSEDAVIEAVKAASNILLEKKYVKFAEPVKTLGEHKVPIDFGNENTVDITLNIVKAD